MFLDPIHKRSMISLGLQVKIKYVKCGLKHFMRSHSSRQVMLLVCTALLLFGSYVLSNSGSAAQAEAAAAGNSCSWYRVGSGDTLTRIARSRHISRKTLARANSIKHINLIFVGQELCIPQRGGKVVVNTGAGGGAVLTNGTVRWNDYRALQWSTRPQVESLLRQAAAQYGLPANLLLAIAWQESGWNQHVIAWDGGIGVMQLMPYTAQSINAGTGIRRNPYVLTDNIYLGATYVSWLYHNFHGNLADTISGYNEGGWSVVHRGIFNWRYVHNVMALMRTF
jgi:LysM repeat protein